MNKEHEVLEAANGATVEFLENMIDAGCPPSTALHALLITAVTAIWFKTGADRELIIREVDTVINGLGGPDEHDEILRSMMPAPERVQ